MIDQIGLSSVEAEEKLEKFGLNDVAERKSGLIKKFLSPLYSPVSLMLLGAAVLSLLSGKIFDFYFIICLYLVNYSIQKWQEFKADRSIKEIQDKLLFDVSVFRDNRWTFIEAKRLVPGDHIRLGLGSIIPADAKVIVSNNLAINEAALTGESEPKEKKSGDEIFSGSFIVTGNVEAAVTATGRNTNFGKTIFSIEQSVGRSILEKDILNITWFLTIISLVAVVILTSVFAFKGFLIGDILTLDLSLIIAGIPIALPAVMAIILSIGAAGLAEKQVVVRRLSALQDLANVNMLLTDKTGTLTKNEIRINNLISYQEGLSTNDVLELALCAASTETPNTIDLAIAQKFEETGLTRPKFELVDYVPYDSDRKRATAFIVRNGKKMLISLGAPQVIAEFDGSDSKEMAEKFKQDIDRASADGFRVMALAVNANGHEEKNMKMAGLLLLADPLDESSKTTVHFMQNNGINVKMVTGDNWQIAKRVAKELDLDGKVLTAGETRKLYTDQAGFEAESGRIAVFAEVLPKDKYELVKLFRTHFVVAATGDGINDLPALKTANVGIAVSSAVSALKSMADIVLLGQGVAVIQDAILESRKIFARLYNYSVYRISESFRLIVTILILGLAYGFYPLVPIQLILLAFLNDIPIISLAVDRVKITAKPSEIRYKERLGLSLLFGSVGVVNSILLFLIMIEFLHLPLPIIQTMFFLKLTISGHSLIFVAHTKERWYKFLPSKEVVIAILATQGVATVLALTGFLMPASISILSVGFVWLWAFLWMQVSELMKDLQTRFMNQSGI